MVIISLNAAGTIEECLRSARFAAEILVVDSGSTDDTLDIARRHGAKTIHQPWLGFGPQKRFAVAQAANDWVLCLDTDERVSPGLANVISKLLPDAPCMAYAMPRRNRFMGRWLTHGEGYPDWNLRLFHRRYANWSDDAVHEKVIATAKVGRLNGDLLHESAEDVGAYIAKQNRYTTLQAENLHRAGRRATALQVVGSPLARFIRFYVLRLGFLDGFPGIAWAYLAAFHHWLKYAKLKEMENSR